eukprot:gene108-4357_t
MDEEDSEFYFLPKEISLTIFSYLDLPSLLKFGRTCKEMFKFSETVWETYHNMTFGKTKYYEGYDWRSNYILRCTLFSKWKNGDTTLTDKPKKQKPPNYYYFNTPPKAGELEWTQLGSRNLFNEGSYQFNFRLKKIENLKELISFGLGVFDFRQELNHVFLDYGVTKSSDIAAIYFPCSHFNDGDILTIEINRNDELISVYVYRDEIYSLVTTMTVPDSHEQIIFAGYVKGCTLTTILKHHFFI